MTTPQEEIAGQVMAEIVSRQGEAATELNLALVWEVVEVATSKTLHYLLKQGDLPLVAIARASERVMNEIKMGRKIQAIKELRAVSRAGLKEAKDAVEIIWDEDGISSAGAPL